MSEQKITLQDAARRFVKGYKEHWYPSIQKFARSQGFVDPASIDECKRILRLWGAQIQQD